jgi:DNA-binding MarR family transcriptional regulator
VQRPAASISLNDQWIVVGRPATRCAAPPTDQPGVHPFPCGELAALARAVTKARTQRLMFFRSSLFSEPAWDILLELFASEGEGKRLSISSVGLTARIPLATVLRWIAALERECLVARADDPMDARRTFLKLTDEGHRKMARYFESYGRAPSA